MQNIIQSFILYLSSWSRRRNIHQDRYSWSFQACWCNSPVSCSFRYSEHIHRCLSQNNQKKASAQINQNENMHKTRKTLGALSPSWLTRVAQLVVAHLVCRSVDVHERNIGYISDMILSLQILDIYHRYKSSILYSSKPVVKWPCPQM